MTREELMKQSAEALIAWLDAPADNKPGIEWSHQMSGCPYWNPTLAPGWNITGYHYRLAPKPEPKIAAGHNPDNLTEEQVGVADGWRLLSVEERKHREGLITPGIEIWRGGNAADGGPMRWDPSTSTYANGWYVHDEQTFRTKQPPGYYLPQPKKIVRKPLAPGVLKAGMRLRHESWERFHEAIITKIRGNGDIEYSDTPIWVELSDLADGWHYAPTVNDDFRPCWTEVEE